MKFGVSDVFDCIEISFDRKKIVFQLIGTAIAVGAAFLGVWLGSLSSNGVVASAAQLIGFAVAFLSMIVTLTAVSRMSYKELTTGEKLSAKEALGFCKKKISSIIITPLLVVLAAVLLLAAEYLVFLLGRFAVGQIFISVFSGPVLLINALIVLLLTMGIFVMYPIIAVDESGPVKTLRKMFAVITSAPMQVLMSSSLATIIIVPVIASLAGLLSVANITTITLFGAASGIFAEMAATEIPSIATPTYIAWGIFVFSLVALSGAILSFSLVYVKTTAVSIYMNIKGRIK